MQKIFWIYITIIFIGIIFLLLPENSDKLVAINEFHGPSFVDAFGLLLIIACWAIMLVSSIVKYKKILHTLPAKWLAPCIATILTGSIWIVISLLKNGQYGWIPGTFLAVAGYAVLFLVAYKKT